MLETCITLLKVAILSITDTVKALLPVGFLPRKSVNGEIILITGSGSGIGSLLAVEFAKLGARLILWDVDKSGNDRTIQQIKDIGGEAYSYVVDLANRGEIYATAEKVKKEVGDVDILINNAGIVTGKKFLECPDELMEKTMTVNCTSHFFTTKAFLPHMLEMDHGHIVTIASIAGVMGTASLADYCASKHGAVGFARSLASEMILLNKKGVHSTVVCPFYINTGMFDGCVTKFPTLLPILEPEYVVQRIIEAVLTNKEVLYLPKSVYFAAFLASFLSANAAHVLEDYLGTMYSMEHFVGRKRRLE